MKRVTLTGVHVRSFFVCYQKSQDHYFPWGVLYGSSVNQEEQQPLPNFGSRHTSLLFTNIRCETVTSIYVIEILLNSLLL